MLHLSCGTISDFLMTFVILNYLILLNVKLRHICLGLHVRFCFLIEIVRNMLLCTNRVKSIPNYFVPFSVTEKSGFVCVIMQPVA